MVAGGGWLMMESVFWGCRQGVGGRSLAGEAVPCWDTAGDTSCLHLPEGIASSLAFCRYSRGSDPGMQGAE